jgi:hypothetical protein
MIHDEHSMIDFFFAQNESLQGQINALDHPSASKYMISDFGAFERPPGRHRKRQPIDFLIPHLNILINA